MGAQGLRASGREQGLAKIVRGILSLHDGLICVNFLFFFREHVFFFRPMCVALKMWVK